MTKPRTTLKRELTLTADAGVTGYQDFFVSPFFTVDGSTEILFVITTVRGDEVLRKTSEDFNVEDYQGDNKFFTGGKRLKMNFKTADTAKLNGRYRWYLHISNGPDDNNLLHAGPFIVNKRN